MVNFFFENKFLQMTFDLSFLAEMFLQMTFSAQLFRISSNRTKPISYDLQKTFRFNSAV